jgi:hypothetical protein
MTREDAELERVKRESDALPGKEGFALPGQRSDMSPTGEQRAVIADWQEKLRLADCSGSAAGVCATAMAGDDASGSTESGTADSPADPAGADGGRHSRSERGGSC